MAVIQKVAILLSLISFGECVPVLLGDPFTFPETEDCPADQPGTLSRVGDRGTSAVAVRERGVWTPVPDYEDRALLGASFAFNRTVYTDTGLYELRCGGREQHIDLSVVIGSEAPVYEGAPTKLLCYITRGPRVDSVRWEKGSETVLEQNLSSGEITRGPASDGTQSLSPDGRLGDYSLMFNRVQPQHQGDYFCSVHTNGARQGWGNPAAARLKVTTRSPDPTTLTEGMEEGGSASSTEETEQEHMGTWAIIGITAAVVFVAVAPTCLLLGWYLKTRLTRPAPGPSPHPEVKEREGLLNGGPHCCPPQANGCASSQV